MRSKLFRLAADWLIEKAKQRLYFDLKHADGSLYMGRWWLIPFAQTTDGCFIAKWYRNPMTWVCQKVGIAVRVHHLATPDIDRHMHDHPWAFISVVLRGAYIEVRPLNQVALDFDDDEKEPCVVVPRACGSICFRGANDRHRITHVAAGCTYTLFITFKKVQWWGFYTPKGKIAWWEYPSVHKSTSEKYGEI